MALPLGELHLCAFRKAKQLEESHRPRCFYIGITEGVKFRFTNSRYGYCLDGYTDMHALACVTAFDACILEKRLISFFRKWQGNQNEKHGGEGVSAANPWPYFVYFVVKRVY